MCVGHIRLAKDRGFLVLAVELEAGLSAALDREDMVSLELIFLHLYLGSHQFLDRGSLRFTIFFHI